MANGVFFDYRGVVHHKFVPEGQAVNKEYYLAVLRRLRKTIRRKRPDLYTVHLGNKEAEHRFVTQQ